jgi:hypothetical protein
VTATVEDGCQALVIEADDMIYTALSGVPAAWRGTSVEGELHLIERLDGGHVKGVFGDSSGASVEVKGRPADEMVNAACGIWPEQLDQD